MKANKYLFLFLLILTSCQSHMTICKSSWHSTEIFQKDDKKKLVKSELYIFPDKQQVKFVNYYLGGVVETLEDKYRVDGKYIVIDAGKMPPFFVAIEMGNEFMKYKVDESISITYRRIE